MFYMLSLSRVGEKFNSYGRFCYIPSIKGKAPPVSRRGQKFELLVIVESEIVKALGGAYAAGKDGEVKGNAVRLHARDEIADGTLAHGADLVGAMARVPFIFIAVISLGFVAMLVASFDARRREFTVLRSVGATRLQLARVLVSEALSTAVKGIVTGIAGGSLIGWLCTAATRAAMSNWGLPAYFSLPAATVAVGALGAVVFALTVSVPVSLYLLRRNR